MKSKTTSPFDPKAFLDGRACATSFDRLANRRTSPLVQSVRTAIARPIANDPPFATLNHCAGDLGIPRESINRRIGITPLRILST